MQFREQRQHLLHGRFRHQELRHGIVEESLSEERAGIAGVKCLLEGLVEIVVSGDLERLLEERLGLVEEEVDLVLRRAQRETVEIVRREEQQEVLQRRQLETALQGDALDALT